MRTACQEIRRGGQTLGFVPTMGYLHAGHLGLVKRAAQEADQVAVSIYVNPTQFAAGEDLSSYPRDLDGDMAKLESAGCNILYLPKQAEIYPAGFATYVVPEAVTSRYEGAARPTHFRGVATVVAKLFNILVPDVAVFGQKDAQQVAVIARMIRDLSYGVRLVVVDTMREPDGLAMSSRNVYLDADARREALSISAALRAAQQADAAGASVADIIALAQSVLSPAFKTDYIDVVDPETFEPAGGAGPRLAIIAGRLGRTRLIDNMRLGDGGR